MFLCVEPLTVTNCEFFILTQAVVVSMAEKTRPAARKSPASIPKSWGREWFMASGNDPAVAPWRRRSRVQRRAVKFDRAECSGSWRSVCRSR